MSIKSLGLILTLVLSCISLRGQGGSDLDSLKHCLYHCKEDSTRLKALLSYTGRSAEYEYNLKMLDSALEFSGTADDPSVLAINLAQSRNFFMLHEYREAISRVRTVKKLAIALKDTKNIITANNNLNILYYRLSKPDSSFYYLNENYPLLRHSTDTFGIAANLNGLGLYFQKKEKYNKAKQYYFELESLAQSIADPDLKKRIFLTVYGNLGLLYTNKDKPDSAIYYLEKELALSPGKHGTLNNLGNAFKDKGNLDRALEYYKEVYSAGRSANDLYYISTSANNIAIVLNLQGKYADALFYAREAEQAGDSIGNLGRVQVSLEEQLTAHKGLGNSKVGLVVAERLLLLNDSLSSERVKESMAELETTYELKEKSSALELSQARNELQQAALEEEKFKSRMMIGGLILVLLIVGIILFFYFRLRRAKADLAEANAVKDRFFAIIAHDLRGGFSGFTGIGPMIEKMLDKDQKEGIKQVAYELEGESLRMEKMLDNLLQWAMVQLDRIRMKPERLKLNELIRSRLDEMERMVKSKDISVDVELKADVAKADADATSFVLRNLLTNAVKFSHPGSAIKVASEDMGDKVMITVRDEGVGMDKTTLQNIFDPAHKVSHTGTAGERGNGLGLVLSKEFAERNRGDLKVESIPGEGSVFKFYIPAA